VTRMRSPNYPAISLGEAIALVRRLYDAEKRSVVSPHVAAEALGYQGMSGPARSRLSALRKYGLVDDERDGIRVSNRALNLLLHEADAPEYLEAAREAALEPEIFRDIFDSHYESSDSNLRNHLIIKLGFSDGGAKHFVKAFRETLELARLPSNQYAPSAEPQVQEASEPRRTPLGRATDLVQQRQQDRDQLREGGRVYSWPLSRGVTAEVRLSGGVVLPHHLETLRQYLALAKQAIEEDDELEPPSPSASPSVAPAPSAPPDDDEAPE
jgi:hypothetical protein